MASHQPVDGVFATEAYGPAIQACYMGGQGPGPGRGGASAPPVNSANPSALSRPPTSDSSSGGDFVVREVAVSLPGPRQGGGGVSKMKWLQIEGSFSRGMQLEDFEYMGLLGRGGYGSVHLVFDFNTGKEYAVKAIPRKKNSAIPKMIQREFIILQQIQHPNVVGFKFCMINKSIIYLVMSYIRGGDLKEMVDRHKPKVEILRLWFAELVLALDYIHSLGIIHRDVKPANCMIDTSGHLKLIDFGLSKMVSTSQFANNTNTSATSATSHFPGAGHPMEGTGTEAGTGTGAGKAISVGSGEATHQGSGQGQGLGLGQGINPRLSMHPNHQQLLQFEGDNNNNGETLDVQNPLMDLMRKVLPLKQLNTSSSSLSSSYHHPTNRNNNNRSIAAISTRSNHNNHSIAGVEEDNLAGVAGDSSLLAVDNGTAERKSATSMSMLSMMHLLLVDCSLLQSHDFNGHPLANTHAAAGGGGMPLSAIVAATPTIATTGGLSAPHHHQHHTSKRLREMYFKVTTVGSVAEALSVLAGTKHPPHTSTTPSDTFSDITPGTPANPQQHPH